MIIHEMEQRTDEWYEVKCGKISASSMTDVLAGGAGKTRKKYMLKLIAERLSGINQGGYTNAAMQWGIDTEERARETYEMATLSTVSEVGFIEVSEFLGCSPDGLIGDDGLIEIKCPDTTTHLDYILAGKMPSTYAVQVQTQLWISGRQWCDFVSYDPRLPAELSLFKIRVERDEAKIKEIAEKVDAFIVEMLETEAEIIEKQLKGR